MLVRTWMSPQPITISPADSMKRAASVMRENGIRHLPVVDHGRLVGIVTMSDIRKNSPSPATVFSVGEVNYLTDQIAVRDIMTKDPKTVTPDTTVEEAALLGYEHGYGAVPVVQDGRLVGILSRTDLLDIMMNVFQGSGEERRITIEDMPPRMGAIRKIVDVLDRHTARFSSILSFPQRQSGVYTYLVRIDGSKPVDAIVNELKGAGFPVSHVS